jgi:hypothetical protein
MRGRIIRVIAILLLLYTGADMVSPGLCNEELPGLSVEGVTLVFSPQRARQATGSAAVLSTDDSSRQHQPSGPISDDDDCFCCCSHVLPGTAFVIENISDLESHVLIAAGERLPTPPLSHTYHPPRTV